MEKVVYWVCTSCSESSPHFTLYKKNIPRWSFPSQVQSKMVLDLSFQIWWMICKQEFLGSKKMFFPQFNRMLLKLKNDIMSLPSIVTYHSRYQLHLEQSVEPGRTIRSTGRRLTWLWSFRIQSSCWLLLEVFSLISILKHHEFLINIYIYIVTPCLPRIARKVWAWTSKQTSWAITTWEKVPVCMCNIFYLHTACTCFISYI